MTAPLPASVVRHSRVTAGVDVATCGARDDKLVFAMSLSAVTCGACREKKASPAGAARAKLEREARAAFFRRSRTRIT